MATTRTFNDMLNEYLPNRMLQEEMIKRDYILNRVDKDNSWKGGKLIVPFKGAGASSVAFGALTASNDVAEDKYIRGSIDDYIEVWGTMVFNQRDLYEHDGKIPETTFLKILPDTVDEFMDYMKQAVSVQLGSGPHFATLVTDGLAGGTCNVDKIDRFSIDQKIVIDDDNSTQVNAYVTAIDVNQGTNGEGQITVSATRGGAALDISAFTTAQNAKVYHPGVWDGSSATTFTSIRQVLLSAANGGASTVHGVSKLAYPYLQAVNVSGTSITASNILDKIFDAYTSVRQRAKGNANEVLMSYKHLGSVMKLIETQKGAYKVSAGQTKVNQYGWTEIMVTSVRGELKLVGIQEMDDDVIFFLDWKSMTFRSNGFFRKRKAPDGKEYFEVRNTTGYQYLVDISLFGELEIRKPGHNGILHSIPNY